jgi:hypothetical protein
MTTPAKIIDGQGLTSQERQLIANFRATKTSARQFLVDMSAEYKRTLPAEPVRLTLAHSVTSGVHQ